MHILRAAQMFKALGDRTRLRMLALMEQRELTGTQMSDVLKAPRSRITRHLAYLYKSGWVAVRHDRNEAYYSLRPADEPLHEALAQEIIPLLRTVGNISGDLKRCRSRLPAVPKTGRKK
ncbi:MAG: ArsR/SmtB family transcription factor [bacterium]